LPHTPTITMSPNRIESQEFGELLLAEFPELREEIIEYEDLDHLKMIEFALFTVRACKRKDWKTVERCLRLAHRLLRDGDSQINNAVYVSYLETLPRKGKIHGQLRRMMTTDLRKGWDRILDYLSRL
jgi:hypothetical protein